ncbi:hypothetical protein [Thiocapsa roseopersicina]|uniref:hypothetical protein n=1 Tax=Thiocapsa roseopersicina TaxID=1058 RepID=UPI0015873313|nr:hypothetical protein [Thiocapsa roseopersicina]
MGKQSDDREQFLQAMRIVSSEITLWWLTASPLGLRSRDFEPSLDLDQAKIIFLSPDRPEPAKKPRSHGRGLDGSMPNLRLVYFPSPVARASGAT